MNREERLAENEVRFREINEGTRGVSDPEPNSIYCECADRSCVYRVTVPVEKYMEVRRDPCLFFVRPGHDMPEIEKVVEETEQYAVVRKPDDVAHIVRD